MRLREPECLDFGVLIVARDQVELYDYLQSNYGDSTELMILIDRRQGDRRRADQPVRDERRHREWNASPTPGDWS